MTLMPLQGRHHAAPSSVTQAIGDRKEIEELLEEIPLETHQFRGRDRQRPRL